MTIISESGLYELIFKSRRKEAREFTRWVTRVVLPEIRQRGYYARPGAACTLDPQLVVLVTQLVQRQSQGQLAIAGQLSELVRLQRQALEEARARAALARFQRSSALPRDMLRAKLRELVDIAGICRGGTPGCGILNEVYSHIRRTRGFDFIRQKANLDAKIARRVSVLDFVENVGQLAMVYDVAVDYLQDNLTATPRPNSKAALLEVTDPPTTQEREDQALWEFMCGRDSATLN